MVSKKIVRRREIRVAVAEPVAFTDVRSRLDKAELASHCVKIGGQWRYQEKVHKPRKVHLPPGAAREVAPQRPLLEIAPPVDEAEADEAAEDVVKGTPSKLPPNAVLLSALSHPEYRPYLRMAQVGVAHEMVKMMMESVELDSSALTSPKKVMLIALKRANKREQILEETPEETAAAEEKILQLTHKRRVTAKRHPSSSLHFAECELLRLADDAAENLDKLGKKSDLFKIGDANVGFAVDAADVSLVEMISAKLYGDESSAFRSHSGTPPICASSSSSSSSSPHEGADLETAEASSSVKALDVECEEERATFDGRGSFVYKSERFLGFLQLVGYCMCLDVDWPRRSRFLLGWTPVLLDAHLRPLCWVHLRLFELGVYREVDLYFYRDVVKFLASLALALALVLALVKLWVIDDYTDPECTSPWLERYVHKWYSKGAPRSAAYSLAAAVPLIAAPAAACFATYGRAGHFEQQNALLVVTASLAAYCWLSFFLANTAWRKHFMSKVKYSKTYAVIVLLKETVHTKCTVCLVLLFLLYLPTCAYLVGGTVPLYDLKVWRRHGESGATQPLVATYHHVACYYLSFPPRIAPESSRARRGREEAPGFGQFAPHARTHEAIPRVACDDAAGVLLFSVSTVFLVVYALGVPWFIAYLVRVVRRQLVDCEWWPNYETAWHRFGLALKEVEAWSLQEILQSTVRLWRVTLINDARRAGATVRATASELLSGVQARLGTPRGGKEGGGRGVRAATFKRANTLKKTMEEEDLKKKKKKSSRTLLATKKSRPLTCASRFWINLFKRRVWRGDARYEVESDLEEEEEERSSRRLVRALVVVEFVPPSRGIRAWCYRVQAHWLCEPVLTLAVLVSVASMFVKGDACDSTDRVEDPMKAASEGCYLTLLVVWVCGLLFAFEVVVKLVALGLAEYFKSNFNRLDVALLLLWLVDVALGAGTNVSFLKSLKGMKALKALKSAKALKFLRVLKLGKYLAPLKEEGKRWLLRWVSDTPLNDALLRGLSSSSSSEGAAHGAWRSHRSLPAKLEGLKRSFRHAKQEYFTTFREFERDHELVILDVGDCVVDSSALAYLVQNFKDDALGFRVVLLLETLAFVVTVSWLKASQHPWAQCLGGACVKMTFALVSTLKRPYLFEQERKVDELTRFASVCLLACGALLAALPNDDAEDDNSVARGGVDFVLCSGAVACFARLLVLLRVPHAARRQCTAVLRYCDDLVLALVLSQVSGTSQSQSVKCYALEDSNWGLRLVMQWDQLLRDDRAAGLLAWPRTRPKALLSWRHKLFYVKWAAIRGLFLETLRTPTGQCVLHAAALAAEPEVVAWLLHHHPTLLACTDDQRDSPVVIALRELADALLAHEREPTAETDWRRSKLAEILLSRQIQHYRVPWSLPHFRSLGDIAVPLLGELVQQLAGALNLDPPKGFVRVSGWKKFPGAIPDFLSQCFLACRDAVDADGYELGDVGSRTFAAINSSLELPFTTITLGSNFFTSYPICILKLDARRNRLEHEAGMSVSRALAKTTSLKYLDLRENEIDDSAGCAIADALTKNTSLTLLALGRNRLECGAGMAFALALRKNAKLRTLDLACNALGPHLSWQNRFKKIEKDSSGPALCAAMRRNSTLTRLDLSNNSLGAKAAFSLDCAFRKNPQCGLTSLSLSGNALGCEGCKALARALKTKVNLTHLDCARNLFGATCGAALASSLQKSAKLVHLDVSVNGLGTRAGCALALALRDNTSLCSLECGRNGFGPDAARAFALALRQNASLTYLGLGANPLCEVSCLTGSASGAARELGEALAAHKTLASFDATVSAGTAGMDQDELLCLLEGLAKNQSLQHLDLDGQRFGNANVLQLTNILERHQQRALVLERSTKTCARGSIVSRVLRGSLTFVSLEHCSLGSRSGPVAVAALLQLPRVRELRLGGNRVGLKLAERVAECLVTSQCELATLSVFGNELGEQGGLALARAMELNTSLTEVDLARNKLTALVGLALADAVSELQESGSVTRKAHVTALNICDNALGNKACTALVRSLRAPAVTSLNLARVGAAGKECGDEIGLALRSNTIQWRFLNLDGNALGKDGANPIFWALRVNASLRHLGLSSNAIGPDFGTVRDARGAHGNSLASMLEHNFSLQRLDLASNDLSPECGATAARALAENPSIQHLDLDHNAMDLLAGEALATKLETDFQIRVLRLRGNRLSWEGGVCVARALNENTTLEVLDLAHNDLGSCGPLAGRALGEMLCVNNTLKSLNLEANLLGPDAGTTIAMALAKNNTLQHLDLTNNRLDQETGEHLLANLRLNKALLVLRVSHVEIGDDSHRAIHALFAKRAAVLDGKLEFLALHPSDPRDPN